MIDVRITGGGADPDVLTIASRIATSEYPRLHEGGASRSDRPQQVDPEGQPNERVDGVTVGPD